MMPLSSPIHIAQHLTVPRKHKVFINKILLSPQQIFYRQTPSKQHRPAKISAGKQGSGFMLPYCLLEHFGIQKQTNFSYKLFKIIHYTDLVLKK